MKCLYIVVRITKETGDRIDVATRKTKKAAENHIYWERCHDRSRNRETLPFDYEIRKEAGPSPEGPMNKLTAN